MNVMEIFVWRISWCKETRQQLNEIVVFPFEKLQRKPETVQMKSLKSNSTMQGPQLLTEHILVSPLKFDRVSHSSYFLIQY